MEKGQMGDLTKDPDCSEFVEVDPTGRYGRYNEILGKGASKTVYRAFDEYEGIEVAWNQVKLNDFLQSPEELERLYCEIHLLKTMRHKNIMKFYTSWVDTSNRNINFVTEMFTSGTLRQYRQKHRRVNIRAVKHWCRQILKGLLYLHGLDPPVIHRDLKCDNIFVNGNQGEVKIGDLGLAAILRNSHAAHCVGTPEFMAPEIYEEQYNELADIYSFGMCILEMVTFEYPYSECNHPAQIYKKVVSGMKPDALYKVQDPEVRHFVEKCLATVSQRLPARELLKDPFLQIDDVSPSSREDCFNELGYLVRQPSISPHNSYGYSICNELSDGFHPDMENEWDDDGIDAEAHEIELFDGVEDDMVTNMDITIKGRKKEDGRIFFRLRIADKDRKDRKRNIYFLFNTKTDTALSVATEMVEELDITDYEVTNIAEMIDGEVSLLVPDWKHGPSIEDAPGFLTPGVCHNCASNASSCTSLLEYLSCVGENNLLGFHCSQGSCSAAMHGRFEEVTYQADGSEQCVTEGPPVSSNMSDCLDIVSHWSTDSHTGKEVEKTGLTLSGERKMHSNSHLRPAIRKSVGQLCCGSVSGLCVDNSETSYHQHLPDPINDCDYENEIRQELRWLKAKYHMEKWKYQNQQIGRAKSSSHLSLSFDNEDHHVQNVLSRHSLQTPLHPSNDELSVSSHLQDKCSFHFSQLKLSNASSESDINGCLYENGFSNLEFQRIRKRTTNAVTNPESVFNAKSLRPSINLSGYLHRTTSLPVDAVDT